ncbi:hypothetical protein PVL29_024789 [Vitis rotundifolia]|uniref:Uncharacterized protein n=1 Tax=Vitis rotundifolia TaxID=103349 RepID=A0AA38YSU5_VITRO|nr:hypothetical protein PVL29_024789 [Vitis rotundifolia]
MLSSSRLSSFVAPFKFLMRNFRGNLPVLTVVFRSFAFVANMLRVYYQLKARGMAVVWLLISLTYLADLHGAWQHWAYLDNFRGTFRWHICFNFGISFCLFISWDSSPDHIHNPLSTTCTDEVISQFFLIRNDVCDVNSKCQ